MPQLNEKGSGDAYQSWKNDQASAPAASVAPAMPPALRPPRSTSATSCSRSGAGVCGAFVMNFPYVSWRAPSGRRALIPGVRQSRAGKALKWAYL
jgi:hypothetical protein